MCGRFALARNGDAIAVAFHAESGVSGAAAPSFNIAPSEQITIVTDSARVPGRRLAAARWGLVPASRRALRSGPEPFNARIESVPSHSMYREPFARQRVIIPADGFYERERSAARASYFISPPADHAAGFAFAGLASWWRNPDLDAADPGRWLLSATIITRPATGPVERIHDRMPLMLPEELWDAWLNPRAAGGTRLLRDALNTSAKIARRVETHHIGDAWLPANRGRKIDDASLITPKPE